jgi:CRP-like cAMP-binding protein
MVAPTADALILRSMQSLADHGQVRELNPGDVVFAAGEPGDCFFGVLDGQVRLAWGDGSHGELLQAGQCFGEGALVQHSHTRHGDRAQPPAGDQPANLPVRPRDPADVRP